MILDAIVLEAFVAAITCKKTFSLNNIRNIDQLWKIKKSNSPRATTTTTKAGSSSQLSVVLALIT